MAEPIDMQALTVEQLAALQGLSLEAARELHAVMHGNWAADTWTPEGPTTHGHAWTPGS